MVGKWSGSGALLLALVAGNSLYASISGVPIPEFRHSYSLNPNGRVVIQNLYGDVKITSWDRDEVLVQAFKKSSDPGQWNEARVVVDSSGDQVSIRTQYAGSNAEHPSAVEYHIVVPRSANLENVKLINGGLSISGLTGNIKASAVNGSIKAEGLTGEADLSTINGKLEAAFDRVDSSNAISLSSVNGTIQLSLPKGAGAQVTARNLSGGIRSDFGKPWRATGGHRLKARVGRGGARIDVHSVNGGISIRAAWRRDERPLS